MNRSRTLLALLLVGLGSVLAVGGPAGLGHAGKLVVNHLYVLFFAAAAASIFFTVMPRGSRIGPVVLVLAGLSAYVAVHRPWPGSALWVLLGSVIGVLGGSLAMTGATRNLTGDVGPVKRAWAIGVPRTLDFQGADRTPALISACAIGTKLTIDLRQPAKARQRYVELAIACWGGRVEVILPDHWPAVAGRLAQTKAITFSGNLDSNQVFSDPRNQAQYDKLKKISDEWPHARKGTSSRVAVVVHVLGIGGHIALVRPS